MIFDNPYLYSALPRVFSKDYFIIPKEKWSKIEKLVKISSITQFRRNIRTGIRLDLKGEGDVWLTVNIPNPTNFELVHFQTFQTFTKEPVFVQSHYLDVLAEREEEPGQAHRFEQYTTVKVNFKRTNS